MMAKHPRKPERPHIVRMKDSDVSEPTPKAKEPEQCSNCQFSHQKHKDAAECHCRRNPGALIKWLTDWCGEYRPKPQEERIREGVS
jgi:hypothetical protein